MLLRALAAEGLVLPSTVELIVPDTQRRADAVGHGNAHVSRHDGFG
jgi:hypothetical protein